MFNILYYSYKNFLLGNLGKKIFTSIIGCGSLGTIYSEEFQAFKDYQEYNKKLNSDKNSNNNPNPSYNSNPNPNNSSGSNGK